MATWFSRFSLSLLAAVTAFGQSPYWPPGLQVEIKPEHEFYLPGEDIQLTIAIRNELSVPFALPLPFARKSTPLCVEIFVRDPFPQWMPTIYVPDASPPPPPSAVLTSLAPGAEYRARLWLSEACRGGWTNKCEAPDHAAGQFRLSYGYNGVANLAMVEPTFEKGARFFDPKVQRGVRAAVLSHGGVYYVVASAAKVMDTRPEEFRSPTRYGAVLVQRMGPIRRIATSTEPIDQLKVDLTEDGGALVTFRLRDSQVTRTAIVGADWIRADRPELQPNWKPGQR